MLFDVTEPYAWKFVILWMLWFIGALGTILSLLTLDFIWMYLYIPVIGWFIYLMGDCIFMGIRYYLQKRKEIDDDRPIF